MTQENKAKAVVEPAQATPEPTVEELKARLAQHEQDKAQYEKDLKSARDEAKAHQKFGQEKQEELKRQSDLRARLEAIEAGQEILAVALATKGGEDNPEEKQNVLAELQKRRATSEAKLKADADALVRQEYNQKADAIYAQAKALFGEGQEEKLEDIEDLLKSGNIVRAEQRVARASKTPVTKVETPTESEEDRIARLVKEKLAKDYPQMYASDMGLPSGGKPTSLTDAMAKYGRGEISAEEAMKYGVKFT